MDSLIQINENKEHKCTATLKLPIKTSGCITSLDEHVTNLPITLIPNAVLIKTEQEGSSHSNLLNSSNETASKSDCIPNEIDDEHEIKNELFESEEIMIALVPTMPDPLALAICDNDSTKIKRIKLENELLNTYPASIRTIPFVEDSSKVNLNVTYVPIDLDHSAKIDTVTQNTARIRSDASEVPKEVKEETDDDNKDDILESAEILINLAPPGIDPLALSHDGIEIPMPKRIKLENKSSTVNVATVVLPTEDQSKFIQVGTKLPVQLLESTLTSDYLLNGEQVKTEKGSENDNENYFGPYEVVDTLAKLDNEPLPKPIKLKDNFEINTTKKLPTNDVDGALIKSWVMWKIESPKDRQVRLTKERVNRWNATKCSQSKPAINQEPLRKSNRTTKRGSLSALDDHKSNIDSK